MNLLEKLLHIQNDIHIKKNKYNEFGKYYYRDAEDILQTLKPYLLQHNLFLKIETELVSIQELTYIKCVLAVSDIETGETINYVGYAKPDFDKKGMDNSQAIGAACSYAKKYALGNMLLLSDDKDSDYYPPTTSDKKTYKTYSKSNSSVKPTENKSTTKQVVEYDSELYHKIAEYLRTNGIDKIDKIKEKYDISKIEDKLNELKNQ